MVLRLAAGGLSLDYSMWQVSGDSVSGCHEWQHYNSLPATCPEKRDRWKGHFSSETV